jgi:hypothetical protein
MSNIYFFFMSNTIWGNFIFFLSNRFTFFWGILILLYNMNSIIISTSVTVAYVLVSAKNSFIFIGYYNAITPFVAYASSSVICVTVTSILVNF